MAYKVFSLKNGKEVTVYKRKQARHLRLTIDAKGGIKVSIPSWAPYQAGLNFAMSKQSWIAANHRAKDILQPSQAIGKAHHLDFIPRPDISKPTSRISGSSILISYPLSLSIEDESIQTVAEKACIKALRKQAENLLPQRLDILANKNGFEYNNVSIKSLKSRWGSCDQNKDIVLSLFLMQMPWHLIDYVILHELTHTYVLRHGPPFWSEMERVLPSAKACRKELKEYQPILIVN